MYVYYIYVSIDLCTYLVLTSGSRAGLVVPTLLGQHPGVLDGAGVEDLESSGIMGRSGGYKNKKKITCVRFYLHLCINSIYLSIYIYI